jgi:hypothetical protein
VDEHREGEPELAAVEGACWLADDDGVEAAVALPEAAQQVGRLGTALPGQRPAPAEVEVLGDDHRALRFDQGLCSGELPSP